MPKSQFWPATLAIMGFILLAERLGLIPQMFSYLWPVILIVVGLGGLLTADRKEWLKKIKKK